MQKKKNSKKFLFSTIIFLLAACTPISITKIAATTTTIEPLTQKSTPLPFHTATRQPSITPLPTRVTPTVWPPYSPGLDWPEYKIESMEISLKVPPGWQQIDENEFSGENGSLKISTRAVGFLGAEVFCTLEANQNKLVAEYTQLTLWNSEHGFLGCAILMDELLPISERGLIFAWYPQSAGKYSVLEIKVNPEYVMAIENGLKFTGHLTPNKPVLDLVPSECTMNQNPPTQTTINGLHIEEYRLTSADCYSQLNVEAFAGLTPDKAREMASALRIQDEAYYEQINRLLKPLGYSIQDKKIYQGQNPITGALEWIGNPVINQSQTEFYLPVREWMTSKSLIITSQGAQAETYSPFYSSLGYVPTRAFIGDDLFTLSYSEKNRIDAGYSLGLQVLKNGEIIYEMIVFPPNPATGPVRGLYAWDGHWILEITDIIIQDGEILNQKLDYSEMFTWREMGGKPFYFFSRDGMTHISYGSQTLPLQYERVIHQPMCCSGGMVNMTLGESGLAFYAMRDGFWYFVILVPEV